MLLLFAIDAKNEARYLENIIVIKIVKGIVHTINPNKLWVICLWVNGKKGIISRFKSGIKVLRHNAVPSNLFGYFIFNNNTGAWCERTELGTSLLYSLFYGGWIQSMNKKMGTEGNSKSLEAKLLFEPPIYRCPHTYIC